MLLCSCLPRVWEKERGVDGDDIITFGGCQRQFRFQGHDVVKRTKEIIEQDLNELLILSASSGREAQAAATPAVVVVSRGSGRGGSGGRRAPAEAAAAPAA
jgi:hypothetical protein